MPVEEGVVADERDVQLDERELAAQQLRHRRRARMTRRTGWAVFTLIMVAALAGLLGPGPLSWITRSTPDGIVELEYERFARYVGDTNLQLRLRPDPAQPETARVWISSDYLSGVNVRQVVPQPDTWTAVDGGVVLTFPMTAPADEMTVQVQLQPDQIGLLPGAVGVPGRQPVRFWQFIYP
jgi:hypothetical protein